MMGCVGLGLEFVVFCLEKKRIGKDWEIWARFCVDILWLSIGGCWKMGEFSGKGHISMQTGGKHESIFPLPLPAQGPLPVHLLAPIHCVSRKPRC